MKKENRPDAEIPTATIADVAFLLIVFFVITQTFAASQGLDFRMSHDDPEVTVVDPVESILVRVTADASLMVDDRPVDGAQLLAYLEPRLRANPMKPVILRPDDQAPYGAMVAAYELLRTARDRLNLEQDVQIALPTKNEVEQFWQ